MSLVYIIVEGQTEEEFVNNCLSHYLKAHGIENTIPILLETSPGHFGGDLSFARYKQHVYNFLASPGNFIVTSLIDYYQLKNDYPKYTDAIALLNKNDSVERIETAMAELIIDDRFIPYIQLHEFEGILFSDTAGFRYIANIPSSNLTSIEGIINAYPNPELINDGPTTAPSKRLKTFIPKYKKTLHGPIIAMHNGLTPVLAKCPRFKSWIDSIIARSATFKN